MGFEASDADRVLDGLAAGFAAGLNDLGVAGETATALQDMLERVVRAGRAPPPKRARGDGDGVLTDEKTSDAQ